MAIQQPLATAPIPPDAPLIHIKRAGPGRARTGGTGRAGRSGKQGRVRFHHGSGKKTVRGDGALHTNDANGIYVVNGKMVFGAAAYTALTGLLAPGTGGTGNALHELWKQNASAGKHHRSSKTRTHIRQSYKRPMFHPANNPSGSLPGQLMPGAGPKVNGRTGHRTSKTTVTPLHENAAFFGINTPAPHIPAPPVPHLGPIRTFSVGGPSG